MEINKKFCTFPESKLAKEKGFDAPCNHIYEFALTSKKDPEDGYSGAHGWKKGELNFQSAFFINNYPNIDFSNKNWFMCAAPEQWKLIEWFRIKHGIWIYTECIIKGDEWYPKIAICSDAAWVTPGLREKINKFREFLIEFPLPKTPEDSYSLAFTYILNHII